MPEVYFVTGASTGFGALIARALAKEGHTVFAGQYSHSGDTSQYESDVSNFATENNADLRSVSIDLLNQDSVNKAVEQILSTAGKLDAIVHNAGHMHYGPSESFTPEQYMRMFDINVLGAHRLNIAALPHMRQRRSGHLIWISSSSVFGAKSPMLGGYFAAKAAMDSLAQSYARELHPWGIETTIVLPDVFVSGTDHFKDAMQPGFPEIAKEYEEGPTKGVSEQNMKGTAAVVPPGTEPSIVADVVVEAARAARGKKPYRLAAVTSDEGALQNANMSDWLGAHFMKRLGLESLLKVTL